VVPASNSTRYGDLDIFLRTIKYNQILEFVFNNKPFSLVRQFFLFSLRYFPVERRTPSKLDETFQLLAPVTPKLTSILRIPCSKQ